MKVAINKIQKNTIYIGTGLILATVILHYIHYLIFKDLNHTLIFFVSDIAFIPMEVFCTTFVLDRLLEKREKKNIAGKLNILIGVFYAEMGTDLLREFAEADDNTIDFTENAIIDPNWDSKAFKNLDYYIDFHEYDVDMEKLDIKKLNALLDRNRDFLLSTLSNPSIEDHEKFTDMLMALMYMRSELDTSCGTLVDKAELEHFRSIIRKAYKVLTVEWVYYMKYLMENHPSLFKKALISNPFDNRSREEKELIYLNK